MTDQWQELKETIIELRDGDGTGTQQEVCKFLVNYMGILEKQMQEPCEMTAEEYRQRMIQAFHNANTDELIALCVLPTEKEFEHLEWLLKNHYKQKTKTGYWIRWYEQKETEWYTDNIPHCKCSECGEEYDLYSSQFIKYCPNCGAKMVEPQESEG